jgi:hypothetical protein
VSIEENKREKQLEQSMKFEKATWHGGTKPIKPGIPGTSEYGLDLQKKKMLPG